MGSAGREYRKRRRNIRKHNLINYRLAIEALDIHPYTIECRIRRELISKAKDEEAQRVLRESTPSCSRLVVEMNNVTVAASTMQLSLDDHTTKEEEEKSTQNIINDKPHNGDTSGLLRHQCQHTPWSSPGALVTTSANESTGLSPHRVDCSRDFFVDNINFGVTFDVTSTWASSYTAPLSTPVTWSVSSPSVPPSSTPSSTTTSKQSTSSALPGPSARTTQFTYLFGIVLGVLGLVSGMVIGVLVGLNFEALRGAQLNRSFASSAHLLVPLVLLNC
jgi:hypothetical protein